MIRYVTAKELAEDLGIDRSALLKFVKKRSLEFVKIRTAETQHQLAVAFSPEQAEAVRTARRQEGFPIPGEAITPVHTQLSGERAEAEGRLLATIAAVEALERDLAASA